jgi:large subunit ribosomal protein L13
MSEEKAVKKTKAEKNAAGAERIVIDAADCTMGRVAAFAAKQAIGGRKVVIFNAEKALISGKLESLYADMKKRHDGKSYINPRRFGPHRPKNPDRYFRRVVRGMLPWGKAKGRAAFKNVMVYIGRPEREIMRKEHIDLSKAKLEDNSRFKKHYDYFVTLADLCGYLGGRKE